MLYVTRLYVDQINLFCRFCMKLPQTRIFDQLRLPGFVEKLVCAGAGKYRLDERQGLVIANITGYLASLSSLNYAGLYASFYPAQLADLITGNILSAILTALVPLVHRFGRAAGAVYLSAVIFSTIFYFISVLGPEAGIQLHYIGASAVALAILGAERLRLGIVIVVAGTVLHLLTWYLFTGPRFGFEPAPEFYNTVYSFSVASLVFIISLVVAYSFYLVHVAQEKTETLMRNMMPDAIAGRLKEAPDEPIADRFSDASILFADLTGFTPLTAELGTDGIIDLLNDLFSTLDELAARYKVEKIKTIGDAYMAAAGVPEADPAHAENIARMALAIIAAASEVSRRHGVDFNMRVGIACGPVLAGIIGKAKFSYDVWGETVNLAARLEPQGGPGEIMVSEGVHKALADRFSFGREMQLELKGIGKVRAWTLLGEG